MVSMLYNIICSRTFYILLSGLVIDVVITPSDMTDVTDHL